MSLTVWCTCRTGSCFQSDKQIDSDRATRYAVSRRVICGVGCRDRGKNVIRWFKEEPNSAEGGESEPILVLQARRSGLGAAGTWSHPPRSLAPSPSSGSSLSGWCRPR